MKKVLIASTALVAAGLLAAPASASEKINLKLGGFSKWWVVGAWQDDSFQANSNAPGVQADYNTVDVKGDNEIFFGGSTTLDNGIQIGVDIQLEAGGHSDSNTDTIDESYVWISGGFGKFIIGTENNGTYLLHVTAPDAAGNWNEGGLLTGNGGAGSSSSIIAKPTNVTITPGGSTTAIVTDGDADKITYVAPTFYGLTVGASYVPNSGEDLRGPTNLSTTSGGVGEIYGVGALYANTFGGVGVKVSGGWVTYDTNNNGNGSKTGVNEYALGSQLSYAGFTLGGSYRNINANAGSSFAVNDGYAWDLGLQYASGPYAVSAAYFKSSVEGTVALAGKDEVEVYQISGKYALGPGVNVLATVGHLSYEDETGATANENKGWAVMSGLSLAF
jgi:hypothetical protein